MKLLKLLVFVVVMVVAAGAAAVVYVRTTGLSGRATPGPVEARVARAVRALAVPGDIHARRNPVALSPDVLDEGLEHFADHCAVCHANDGSGDTDFGRGLYPKPPDLRAGPTQALTDGDMFYFIEHGIRFTGMPAFGTGDEESEEATWRLVHVIRHLPQLTADELARMQEHNPQSPTAIRQELEEERFLKGDTP